MFPALLLALAISAPPAGPGPYVALASMQAHETSSLGGRVQDLAAAALPPPPETVELKTRMFGVVPVPHATHLSLRIGCKECHGAGRVGKIDFTPKDAHDRCRGCHVKESAGPTGCRDCHVVPEKTPTPDTVAKNESQPSALPESAPPESVAGAPSPAALASHSPAGAAPVPTVAAAPAAGAAPLGQGPQLPLPVAGGTQTVIDGGGNLFRRTVDVGVVMLQSRSDGFSVGAGVTVKAQQGRAVFAHALHWAGGSKRGHTLALVGGGVRHTVADGLTVAALGMGGLDAAFGSAHMFPAIGGRFDLDWKCPNPAFDGFTTSFTVISDLTRPRTEFGEKIGGVVYGLAISGTLRTPVRR
jgi:hypothetical protein